MYKFLTFNVSEVHQCIKSFIYKTSLSKHVCFYQAFTVHFFCVCAVFPEKCNDSRSWDFFLIIYVFAIITNQQASYLVSFYMIQSILNSTWYSPSSTCSSFMTYWDTHTLLAPDLHGKQVSQCNLYLPGIFYSKEQCITMNLYIDLYLISNIFKYTLVLTFVWLLAG